MALEATCTQYWGNAHHLFHHPSPVGRIYTRRRDMISSSQPASPWRSMNNEMLTAVGTDVVEGWLLSNRSSCSFTKFVRTRASSSDHADEHHNCTRLSAYGGRASRRRTPLACRRDGPRQRPRTRQHPTTPEYIAPSRRATSGLSVAARSARGPRAESRRARPSRVIAMMAVASLARPASPPLADGV